MNFEKLGDTFADGSIINLDTASVESLSSTLQKLKEKKERHMGIINKILVEIQG